MISILLYMISVFLTLTLYYFFKPKQDQQQQNSNLDECQLDNSQLDQPDLLSISSNGSFDAQNTSTNDDSFVNNNNNNNNNNTTVSLNTNNGDLNLKSQNEILNRFSPYTFTSYKETKGDFSSSCNKKFVKKNEDALIVEFFKKYLNKDSLYKYLGINQINQNFNSNFGYVSSNQQINDSFK